MQVYLIDDGSTDDTVARAERLRGRGLLDIEQRPNTGVYSQRRLMQRKEELLRTLPGDWFISHDADEFREGPWRGLNLSESIAVVDRLGYNAIDFEVLDFWPTRDLLPGEDPRAAFTRFQRGESFNRTQIRCWKRAPDVVLSDSLGHEARFEGRRIFPMRFLLRHYPLRGVSQGRRKVFEDRQPRFDAAERAGGYHIQYEPYINGASVLRDPAEMEEFDPDLVRARLQLRHRGMEAADVALLRMEELERDNGRLREELARGAAWATELQSEANARGAALGQTSAWAAELQAERDAIRAELERTGAWAAELRAGVEAAQAELERATGWARELETENARLREELARLAAEEDQDATQERNEERSQLRAEIAALRASLSRRITGPARTLLARWRGQ